MSGSLAFDWTIPLFTAAAGAPPAPLFITAASADADSIAEAGAYGDVIVAGDRSVDLLLAIGYLHDMGVGTVLTEGGPHLLGELAALGLLDELCLTLAPVMGGDPLPLAVWPAEAPPADFHLATVGSDDGHLFLRYLQEPLT